MIFVQNVLLFFSFFFSSFFASEFLILINKWLHALRLKCGSIVYFLFFQQAVCIAIHTMVTFPQCSESDSVCGYQVFFFFFFFFVLPFLCYSEFLPTLVYYIMLHLVLPHLVVSVWLWGTVVTLWPLTGFFCFLWWWAMSWPFCCACQLHCVDFYFGMDCD